VRGNGSAGREFVAIDEIGGFNNFIAAAYDPGKSVKTKIDRNSSPGGLLDRTETCFGRIAESDAGGWNGGSGRGRSDGKREKALVVEAREIEAEAAKIVREKDALRISELTASPKLSAKARRKVSEESWL
jgi:hypothetical protein